MPRFLNVTARSIGLVWQPPSNAVSLAGDLLGYRVYVTEKGCDGGREENRVASRNRRRRKCRRITPITINSGRTTATSVRGLSESRTMYY